MARRRSIHLSTGPHRVACGLVDAVRRTPDPASVTCQVCRKTLDMADAEARAQRNL